MRFRRLPHLRFVFLAATVGIAIGLGAALLLQKPQPQARAGPTPLQAEATWAAGTKPAPGLALRDETGATVSLRSLRGRVVLLTFLDSRCRRECPLEGRVLHDALHDISGTRAVVLVVSVDPWADTAASALAFAERAGWSGDWHWLLGKRSELAPVWHAYHIAVKRTPGDILHSAALYLIDPHGDLRSAYLFPFSAAAVVHDVRRLTEQA
jgi:cytochrome oxidase Cu insertion factor (SCO1/SenC/PrrC family)